MIWVRDGMGGWEPRQDMECGRKRGGEGKKGGRSGFIRAKRKNGRPIRVKRRPRCAIVFGGGFAPEEIPGRLHGWMERRGVLGWWYMTGLWPSRFPQADLPNSYPPASTPLPCPLPHFFHRSTRQRKESAWAKKQNWVHIKPNYTLEGY